LLPRGWSSELEPNDKGLCEHHRQRNELAPERIEAQTESLERVGSQESCVISSPKTTTATPILSPYLNNAPPVCRRIVWPLARR